MVVDFLFFRKNKKEKNEISNNSLKEYLADAALNILEKGTDYETVGNREVSFGYLYDIKGRGIESMFKVITDKATIYFAVQSSKLLRLNLTEDFYESMVESFLDEVN